jgi:energy-coupling factor transporter ATP-binding protein EcfA2
MKVTRLRIRNFRNIVDTTLDMDASKFVVLRGKNGQGKTSTAEAISLALTETAWGLDKRGAGFARKIRRGEDESILEVDLLGAQRVIHRTVTLSVGITGRKQKSEDANDSEWNPKKFNDLLTDKATALGIAINTRAFMSMVYSRDEDAQKNILAQLVLPARYEFPKDKIADVEKFIGEGVVNFNGEPFLAIELSYKKLFAERTDVNRKVKEFIVPDALPAPKGVNSESLKSHLSILKEARQKQSMERDAASKKSNEGALKQARAKAKIETLEAVLKANKESLRTLEANILPDPSAVHEVASYKAERDRLLAEQQRLLGEQEAAKKESSRINTISGLGSTCPTCEQDIDDSKLTQLMSSSVSERNRLANEYVKVTQSLGVLGDVDGAIAKLEKHKTALSEKSELAAKIEEQAKELKAAKDEADKDVGGLFDSSTFDKTIADTDSKIEAILQQIQPVIAAEEREKEIATKKEQFTRLEAKAAKLDKLVRYFDKDGVKAKLIAEHIGGFEIKCNEVLKVWDYSCSLSIEPFKFEITDYRGVSTPLIELSGAEELFFYAAFQCAVSRTAGIGLVVIDRIDTLLPDLRPKLYQKLYQMVSDNVLDQVLLLVADTSEQVPKLANSAFYMIEEGNIRRLQ